MQPFPHHYTVEARGTAAGDVELTAPGLPRLRSASPAEFDGPGDRWSVSLFGNNLLDKQYEAGNLYQFGESLGVFNPPTGGGVRNGVFPGSTAVRRLHADPRTVGASFTFRY